MVLLSHLKSGIREETINSLKKSIAMQDDDNALIKENFVSFCDLFKLRVKESPNAIACIFEGMSLTYGELDYRADLLAQFLKKNGVRSGEIVALCLHNSLELLIGILGILQAGGTYLPIDPTYPAGRIERMIQDAKPILVLTQENLRDKFSYDKVAMIDRLSLTERLVEREPIQPDQLAYVVYTSGSTGAPKGIMIEHKALVHAAFVYQKLHPSRLISLLAGSISFDASILVIFHTLISGGVICIPRSGIVDPEYIIRLIEEYKVNYTLCVPSFYALLLRKSKKLLSLESVDLGGENLPNEIPELHTKLAPNAFLYNLYGPSEYAVGATFAKIYDPFSKQINKITIGKSLPDTQVYILDENLKEVSVDVKGEIFIGGKGLAREYLDKKELSAEKFIWVSWPDRDPVRLYKTGDFGRFLPDGNIEFLGRIDHQVKIRGYRIELGEIEYAICQHPGVSNAVVMVQEEGGTRLVAYFSAAPHVTVDALRIYLTHLLPQHMIPSIFVPLEHFPLLPNGKLDRRALPEIKKSDVKLPQTHLEQALANIWQTVLQYETVGIYDNFFDIGGDSLSVANVQTAVQTTLNIEIPIIDLLHYPTVHQLAQHLSQKKEPSIHDLSKHQIVSEKRKAAFQRLKEQRKS